MRKYNRTTIVNFTEEEHGDIIYQKLEQYYLSYQTGIITFNLSLTPQYVEEFVKITTDASDFWRQYFSKKIQEVLDCLKENYDMFWSYVNINHQHLSASGISISWSPPWHSYNPQSTYQLIAIYHDAGKENAKQETEVREFVDKLFSPEGSLYEYRKENDCVGYYILSDVELDNE